MVCAATRSPSSPPTYATWLGRAAASVLGSGDWLIGRDTRESGPALQDAFAPAIAGGATPRSLGVVPTPAVAWLSADRGLPAAMITASHNPWHDNGVKIFAPGGLKLSDDVEAAIERELEPSPSPRGRRRDVPGGSTADDGDAIDPHRLRRLRTRRWVAVPGGGARRPADRARLRQRRHERAGPPTVARARRRRGGAARQPDGRNINDGCGATAPASLAAAVVAEARRSGSRSTATATGSSRSTTSATSVDGDRLIALAALQLRDEGRLHDDTVVVTVMSNLGFHRAMAAHGIRVVETAVGDRYVLEALDAGGYAVGGEQSGPHHLPRHRHHRRRPAGRAAARRVRRRTGVASSPTWPAA
jgi:phosphoglucosamine mutase